MPLCVAGCSGQQPLCIQRYSRSPALHGPLSLLVRSPGLGSVHVFRRAVSEDAEKCEEEISGDLPESVGPGDVTAAGTDQRCCQKVKLLLFVAIVQPTETPERLHKLLELSKVGVSLPGVLQLCSRWCPQRSRKCSRQSTARQPHHCLLSG
eukprot:superscaffoldBa00002688_g15002